MIDFEKLGAFYLGRRLDPELGKPTGELVLYDSRDLITHALCVGMTGSGKTGLGVALIEEAAIDGVPTIVIDPKGDLSNLLLTFPGLTTEEFVPWVSADDVARSGKTIEEFAATEADRWREGLIEWGQDGARIARLRSAAELTLYTPGTTTGRPISVLTSFTCPSTSDSELIRERVHTTVSSLLELAGVESDPLKSREHILLSTILLSAWQKGESPSLATLIQRIQEPPVSRVGVIDLESFFPATARFGFAMAINALLASPGFEAWSQGDPLDVASLLRTSSGKSRVTVFSIAHLDDRQRMFFVALLLNAVVGWMRTQTGTASLRALVYMDEIFGFFPPVANPPSKGPLLTLLKQGRAAGIGVVLATQNPVDLDYKGLSNIGTWWLGRLQTDRDKARVLDGLEGADDSVGFDRASVDRLLSGLSARTFLMRNVHEDGLTLFQSRWAMSYLRGPLDREGLKRLSTSNPTPDISPEAPPVAPSPPAMPSVESMARPVMAPDVPQFFSPEAFESETPLLHPVIYCAATVRFVDPKLGVDTTKLVTAVVTIPADRAMPVDWDLCESVDWTPEMLESEPPNAGRFVEVPGPALRGESYEPWGKQFVARLMATEALRLFKSPSTGEISRVDESEREFRARLQHASREARDRAVELLRKKFAPRLAALDERMRRAQQAVDRETDQASGQKLQTAISIGATIAGALFGRKMVSAGSIGRATTAARGVGRSMKENEDIERARQTLAAIAEQRLALDRDLTAETAAVDAVHDISSEEFQSVAVKPKRTNIGLKVVALVWRP